MYVYMYVAVFVGVVLVASSAKNKQQYARGSIKVQQQHDL